MRSLLVACAACALLVPLSGCATLKQLASALTGPRPAQTEIRALAALPPPDPAAAVDRLYGRAAEAIKARDYALAIELLQLAASRAPADARVLNAQGVVYDKLGRFDLSERYYARALQANPGSRIVLSNMAYSARLQGREPPAGVLQAVAQPQPPLAGGPPAEVAPLPGGGS
ncbi:hypothetical protein CFHF_12080 [Caulobacter flavus]|uniref:Uncharacterized protein n=1 Tax=Caulobacter flavus TaxID=1679497 RepID=A0A2N5CTK5_9CAUL|nr:tetratricopeptide repeat protein [Caulobacter flavus]AYV47745.1 hypothetical protein C1707_16585 [Caulobacter flavus]PLR15379.1 hypothetical protein CFHF_12080 [Caulobacter flavus]